MAYLLKEQFTKLASWLNNTGLPDALNREKDLDEMKDLWKFFEETNGNLIAEAKEWKKHYQYSKLPIFKTFEEVKLPLAVACLIKIMGIKEDELFGDKDDLQAYLKKEHRQFSTAVANLMNEKYIKDITAEDFFSK